MSHLEIVCQNLKGEDMELLLKYVRNRNIEIKGKQEKIIKKFKGEKR